MRTRSSRSVDKKVSSSGMSKETSSTSLNFTNLPSKLPASRKLKPFRLLDKTNQEEDSSAIQTGLNCSSSNNISTNSCINTKPLFEQHTHHTNVLPRISVMDEESITNEDSGCKNETHGDNDNGNEEEKTKQDDVFSVMEEEPSLTPELKLSSPVVQRKKKLRKRRSKGLPTNKTNTRKKIGRGLHLVQAQQTPSKLKSSSPKQNNSVSWSPKLVQHSTPTHSTPVSKEKFPDLLSISSVSSPSPSSSSFLSDPPSSTHISHRHAMPLESSLSNEGGLQRERRRQRRPKQQQQQQHWTIDSEWRGCSDKGGVGGGKENNRSAEQYK
eukprot:m.143657 g.143657  ORF g.143657 m.143657 type:complete len:326 (-) comp13210_c3_seq2:85-1062(-)